MIRYCFDDLERIREIQPLRRKTILTILSEYVDAEVEQMRKSGKRQRHRYPPNADAPCAFRGQTLLPTSLRSIVRRLWPEAHPEEHKKLRRMLSKYSRYGWKWQQVQPRGMILSLPDCAAKRYFRLPLSWRQNWRCVSADPDRFETTGWNSIEFEAINQFVKTLPQYRIQTLLRSTIETLVSFYNGKVQLETSSATPAYSIRTEGTGADRQSPILGQCMCNNICVWTSISDGYYSTFRYLYKYLTTRWNPNSWTRSFELHYSSAGFDLTSIWASITIRADAKAPWTCNNRATREPWCASNACDLDIFDNTHSDWVRCKRESSRLRDPSGIVGFSAPKFASTTN